MKLAVGLMEGVESVESNCWEPSRMLPARAIRPGNTISNRRSH